jgi:hypothetical protein
MKDSINRSLGRVVRQFSQKISHREGNFLKVRFERELSSIHGLKNQTPW